MSQQREEALASFDFQLAQIINNRITSERENAQQEFNNIIKLIELSQKEESGETDIQKEARERLFTSSRQIAIADVFDQGITDATRIQQLININEEGKQVGDITIEEINDVLDTKKIIDDDNQFIKLDNGNYELRNKNTGELVKLIGGASIETTGGNREDLDSFQILQARSLSISIFGKRAGAKPENYGLIEDLLVRGMTPDEIGDKLRFSEQSAAFEGAFKSAFEFVTKSMV